jgi:hypothetical protein
MSETVNDIPVTSPHIAYLCFNSSLIKGNLAAVSLSGGGTSHEKINLSKRDKSCDVGAGVDSTGFNGRARLVAVVVGMIHQASP